MTDYTITANGTPLGTYSGEDEAEALDAFARDAGYRDYDDLLANVPDSSGDEVEVAEVGA